MTSFARKAGFTLASLLVACALPATAATKADYEATKDRAKADYQVASDRCKTLAGNTKDICVAEAKAARTRADETGEADYKNTPKAREDAADNIAEADYDVAKQRCDAKTSNAKDVCLKEAKAAQVKAKADAKVATKTDSVRADAAGDKRDANYKVAMEKCDGFSGDTKDACQKSAKANFGK